MEEGKDPDAVSVSNFDSSADNFLASMDSIRDLCGLPAEDSFDASEIERFSSMITFLKEWKHFVYEPKTVKFACDIASGQVKDDFDGINLPQFSSAAVPKMEKAPNEAASLESDFVLHAGGLIWAMDWCPTNIEESECSIKCEYLAVSAHPPGSTYHKIGAPLAGRGIIQIWCLLTVEENVEFSLRRRRKTKKLVYDSEGKAVSGTGRPIGRPKGSFKKHKKNPESSPNKEDSVCGSRGKEELTMQRPRGRPKGSYKKRPYVSLDDLNGQIESSPPSRGDLVPWSSLELKETPSESSVSAALHSKVEKLAPRRRGRPREKPTLSATELVPVSENIMASPVSVDLNMSLGSSVPSHEPVSVIENSGPDMNRTLELSLPRRRGRPRKKLLPIANEYVQASGVNLGNDVLALSTAIGPENLTENIKTLPVAGDSNVKLGSASAEYKDDSSSLPSSKVFGTLTANTVVSSVPDGSVNQTESFVPKRRGRPKKTNIKTYSVENCEHAVPVTYGSNSGGPMERCGALRSSQFATTSTTCGKKRKIKQIAGKILYQQSNVPHLSTVSKQNELAMSVVPENKDHCKGAMVLREEITMQKFQIPKDIALPKFVLSLAHMGKVAWDVKWRPSKVNYSEGKYHLGYLAALLGNGSLEVWEVPLPGMVKILYTSSPSRSDGTDPRFIKLKPIFRCSKVRCGERQSIPLTVEWSPSAPHDLILAGCHDGTVALWKFSKQLSCQDIKPLLCFSAESVPIRSLAWAPDGSSAESANLIATVGHEGLKFWDLRDPFHPLWEFNPVQRIILSIEWLKDPSCLIMSFDDGALRLLSLWKVANDLLFTGEPSGLLKQPGLHTYLCSHFAIWSLQVSRATGLAAYCTADGSACFFQLTANVADNRCRESHFLCGSLTADDKVLKIKSPLPNVPLSNIPFKKIPNGLGDAPLFSLLSEANQARGNQARGVPVSAVKPKSKPTNKTADEKTIESTENAQKIEELPAKDVALHKVRWNMNKGSARWLCYGGAGGIIRCQAISLDAVQK